MVEKRVQATIDHADDLPEFADPESASRELFGKRDEVLRLLVAASAKTAEFEADYSPDSLEALENWYFDLWEHQSFFETGMGRSEFETAMAFYFGETLARNVEGFEWLVEEYAFLPGRYEIGVGRERLKIMLSRFTDLFARPGNTKRDSIRRAYRKYAG
jgi:hypothetical protein